MPPATAIVSKWRVAIRRKIYCILIKSHMCMTKNFEQPTSSMRIARNASDTTKTTRETHNQWAWVPRCLVYTKASGVNL